MAIPTTGTKVRRYVVIVSPDEATAGALGAALDKLGVVHALPTDPIVEELAPTVVLVDARGEDADDRVKGASDRWPKAAVLAWINASATELRAKTGSAVKTQVACPLSMSPAGIAAVAKAAVARRAR